MELNYSFKICYGGSIYPKEKTWDLRLFYNLPSYCFLLLDCLVSEKHWTNSNYIYKIWKVYVYSPLVFLSINPIQDGHFQSCSRDGKVRGAKRSPSLKSVTHILKWWNLAVIPYLKKIQKIYESRETPTKFCGRHKFFSRNQQILLYKATHIQISFWCIIPNSFNFFWVFKDFQ